MWYVLQNNKIVSSYPTIWQASAAVAGMQVPGAAPAMVVDDSYLAANGIAKPSAS